MKQVFIIIIFSIVIFSCQKTDPSTNPTSITGKVKTVTTTQSGGGAFYAKYYYNNDGTLNYYTGGNSNMGYLAKTTYTYTQAKIIGNVTDASNNAIEYRELVLNANGLVDSSITYLIPPTTVSTSKYQYNANNEPIIEKGYQYNYGSQPSSTPIYTLLRTFNNGNIIKFINVGQAYYFTYDYYTIVSNLTPEAFGLPYSLNMSNNLSKYSYQVEASNPSNILIHAYSTYTFDSNNRVETATTHMYTNGVDNGSYSTSAFTYY